LSPGTGFLPVKGPHQSWLRSCAPRAELAARRRLPRPRIPHPLRRPPYQFYDMVRRKDHAGLAARAERTGFPNLHAWIEDLAGSSIEHSG